jgi:hypothetical protein
MYKATDNPELLRQPIFDFQRMQALARERAADYRSAGPFPHIVLDGLVPAPVLEAVCGVIPSPEAPMPWRRVEARFEDGQAAQARKLGLAREFDVAPLVRRLFWELNSGCFLRFLGNLTGIQGLIPDPSLQGSGIHQILEGGVLAVHADFTWHKVYALARRINVLIYLNHGWQEEWGGHLQLWTPDMQHCARRIMPTFGRCVIFNTSARSFHGHPEPLRCPPGVTRRSIAMYYYTAGRDDEGVADTVATDWRKAPQDRLPVAE